MKLNSNILDCSELQIARDIPKELTFYKAQYQRVLDQNHLYKKALIITASGISVYLIYKIINHYAAQKNKKRTDCKRSIVSQYNNEK